MINFSDASNSSKPLVGYCTNVHPGTTLENVQSNLAEYALAIKKKVRPSDPMGIGLWLCRSVCDELIGSNKLQAFAQWLKHNELIPFTFNGFPYSDFHQSVVKQRVYSPTWAETERLEYTLMLADIQNTLLGQFPEQGSHGSISTLPLGWPTKSTDDSFFETCAENLRTCADRLYQLHQETGRHLCLSIEPEPGCVIDNADDLVTFFSQHFCTGDSDLDDRNLEYVGVCHDVCHSAVMFEDQSHALNSYQHAGIRVGKYQISSAIAAHFGTKTGEECETLIAELSQFDERRYLHQTMFKLDENEEFFEELPNAIKHMRQRPEGEWRVHFHVPLYLEAIGNLKTTQNEIRNCLKAIHVDENWPLHFELETYAWSVLPDGEITQDLAEGITREFEWFDSEIGTPQR